MKQPFFLAGLRVFYCGTMRNITAIVLSVFNISAAPVVIKSVHKRPYKSRSERRERDRRKHDEASDYKFLWRMAGGIGLLLLLALGFAIKGATDGEIPPASLTELNQ